MRHIYTFKNLANDKIYVGQTKHPERRELEHLKNARQGVEGRLYWAIRKHGEENFLFEVIENCEDDITNQREEFWITYFDSFENGYNSTTGGDHYKLSEEAKKKIGLAARRPMSEEQKQKLREVNKGKKPPPHSEETLRKMSESMKGKNTGPKSEEHRRKLSEARRKWKLTEEQKKKIAENKKPVSEETRQKLSAVSKGRKRSEETKKRMSESQKGKPRPSPSQETIEKRRKTQAKNREEKRRLLEQQPQENSSK
jgi:group I intron endonuclease